MKNIKNLAIGMFFAMAFPVVTHAIGIDTMIAYTNPEGEAEFTITNSDDYRQYVNVLISEMVIVNGEIKKIPYTKGNISKWSLSAYPARAILEPKFKKNFSLVYKPVAGEPVVNADKVFQVSFVPTPYFADGEEKKNAVKMAFGFAPLVIVPAKELKPLTYDLKYQGNKVMVENKGHSFFTIYLNGCPEDVSDAARDKCSLDTTVLAGRKLVIPLPESMAQSSTLQVKLASFGNKFKAEATLRKQS